jgi:hypothetical protein
MDTRREAQIQRQIEKVKRDLAAIGDLRPGSLSTQNTVCSSPGCHCKANPPIKHGPYNQLSYTRKGRSSTKFIRDKHLSDIQKQVSNYQTMKMLLDQWIDLARELSDLRMAQDRG